MASRGYTSAGITYRLCGDCNGAGEQVLEHWSRDPQLEVSLKCCSCSGHGYIRASAIDPLEALAAERRNVVRQRRAPADSLGAFLFPTASAVYRRTRACAMAPASLPTDIAPRPALEFAA